MVWVVERKKRNQFWDSTPETNWIGRLLEFDCWYEDDEVLVQRS